MHNADDKALDSAAVAEQWSPNFVGEEEFVLLTRLCQGREVRSDDPEMIAWLKLRGVEFGDVRNRLLETRLVASSGKNLKLIAKKSQLAILPTGECVAAENSTDRLDRWIFRRIENLRD